MKKLLSIITITAAVAVVMASCKNTPVTTNTVSYDDTVGLAKFQEWKVMNERLDANDAYMKDANTATTKKASTYKNSGTMNSQTTNNAKVAKKKGWSKTAKYSAIGGGAGIVLGAVINKRNPVAGGIIGGVIGGGVGYGIGRSQDKKDGRIN